MDSNQRPTAYKTVPLTRLRYWPIGAGSGSRTRITGLEAQRPTWLDDTRAVPTAVHCEYHREYSWRGSWQSTASTTASTRGGARGRTQTCILLLRKQALLQLSYVGLSRSGGARTRTSLDRKSSAFPFWLRSPVGRTGLEPAPNGLKVRYAIQLRHRPPVPSARLELAALDLGGPRSSS